MKTLILILLTSIPCIAQYPFITPKGCTAEVKNTHTTSIGDILDIIIVEEFKCDSNNQLTGTIMLSDINTNNFLHDHKIYYADIFNTIKATRGEPINYTAGDNGDRYIQWEGLVLAMITTDTTPIIAIVYYIKQ